MRVLVPAISNRSKFCGAAAIGATRARTENVKRLEALMMRSGVVLEKMQLNTTRRAVEMERARRYHVIDPTVPPQRRDGALEGHQGPLSFPNAIYAAL